MFKDPFIRKAFMILLSMFAIVGLGCVLLLELSGLRVIRGPITHTEVFTDIAKLEARINVPIQPHAVQWQVIVFSEVSRINVPPGGAYSLVAVLEYTPEELQHLKTLSGTQPRAQSGSIAQRSLQPWLPDPIHAAVSPAADERMLQLHLPAYAADAFVQPGMGWQPGFWTPLEQSSQVLLVMWNMN